MNLELLTLNRNDGYINLNEIIELPPIANFDELVTALQNNRKTSIKSVSKAKNNLQLVFSFNYNETIYFYKYDCPREPFKVSPYNELIACEIANDLGIPHVNYDLACICGFNGLISKDFRLSNVNYITGKDFLVNNHPLGKKENIAELNNLEDIWIALENRYNGNSKYQDIISDVMQKIVNMFIYDIITGQVDRGYLNWWLIEYSDGTLDLQPLFDNIRILMLHHRLATERFPSVSKLLLKVNKEIERYFEDNLEEFLKFSDKDFVEILSSSLWVISKENIQNIFSRIEKKTNHCIPNELKDFYLKEFDKQLKFITETYDKIVSNKHRVS